MKLRLLSLLSPAWVHPAYIGAIAAACMHALGSEQVTQEAAFKLNGLKTAIQTFHKLRAQSRGGQSEGGAASSMEEEEAGSMEEVVCVLLRLCLGGGGGGGGGSSEGQGAEEAGLRRLLLREEVRVTLLNWVRSEMAALLSRPAVAALLLRLVRHTFGPCLSSPSLSSASPGTVSLAQLGSHAAGPRLQAVVLALANVLSKYLHSYLGVQVNYSPPSSPSSAPAAHSSSVSIYSLPLLLQSVSSALSPFADNCRKSSDENEVLVKKVSPPQHIVQMSLHCLYLYRHILSPCPYLPVDC